MKRSDLIIISVVIVIFALLLFMYAKWISKRAGADQPNATEKLSQKLDELIEKIDQANYMTKPEMEAALKSALNEYAEDKKNTVITILPGEGYDSLSDGEIRQIIEDALSSYFSGELSEDEIIEIVSGALAEKGSGLSPEKLEAAVKEALSPRVNENTDPDVIASALEKGGFGLTSEQIENIVNYLTGNGGIAQ